MRTLALVLGLVLLVPLFGQASPSDSLPPVLAATLSGAHVVVAVVDTGVNPYHRFFAAPALSAHPSSYVDEFPPGPQPVPLTLQAATLAAARAADAAAWSGIQRSVYDAQNDTYDTHLYTFPGTRVVAGLSFSEYSGTPGGTPTPIWDDHGHGTRSSGLALGADLYFADGNVLLVIVEVGQGDFGTGIRWAARQPWIDAISVSLGTVANVPYYSTFLGENGADDATREAVASGKPVFVASGNGVTGTGLAPDRCSTYTSEYNGPAWVTNVGAYGPNSLTDSEEVADWHCAPVDAIARTTRDSTDAGSLAGVSRATGTSASAPNLAGLHASLLLRAWRADLPATARDVERYLLNSSLPAGMPLPPAPVYAIEQGFGFADPGAVTRAWARLSVGQPPNPRPDLDAWWEHDTSIRDAIWGPGGPHEGPPEIPSWPGDPGAGDLLPPDTVPHDDGGSGSDAGTDLAGAVPVEPGTLVEGTLFGYGIDDGDAFSFPASQGQTLRARFLGTCLSTIAPSGFEQEIACPPTTDEVVTRSITEGGTWRMLSKSPTAMRYRFSFTLDGSEPPLL